MLKLIVSCGKRFLTFLLLYDWYKVTLYKNLRMRLIVHQAIVKPQKTQNVTQEKITN